MSSPVFGGKMTSTSGKTRLKDSSDNHGVTSNLQACSSRDKNCAIAAVDTVVSDGSVSPFEACDTVRGAERVGGGRNVLTPVTDVFNVREDIPMIVFTNIENNTARDSDGFDTKTKNRRQLSNSGYSANNRNNNNINNNKDYSGKNRNSNGESLSGNPGVHRNAYDTVSKTYSSNSNKPVVKGTGMKEKDIMEERQSDKRDGKDSAQRFHDNDYYYNNSNNSYGVCSKNNDNNETTDFLKSKELRRPMLKNDDCDDNADGGEYSDDFDDDDDDDDGDGVDMHNDNVRGDGNRNSNDKMGILYHKVDDKKDDECNDSSCAVEERQGHTALCCLSAGDSKVNNKCDDSSRLCCSNDDTEVNEMTTYNFIPGNGERKRGVPIRGIKVKTKVRFEDSDVDDNKAEAEIEREESLTTKLGENYVKETGKVEKRKVKVETKKPKVELKKRKNKRTVRNSSGLQYGRVMNMIVLVPNIHLIPEGRRYEDYFKIKPHEDVEIGRKPKWVVPRLKYYFNGMGCGTSNQVISMEGKMPIVVFGATGVIGGSVVKALLKDPRFMVRAVTRTPTTDQARLLAEIGAVVVPADLNDVRSLQRVMDGAAGVFLTTNFWEHLSKQKELTHGMNAVDAAVSCNVHHFIFQGSDHTRDEDKPCGHLNSKAAIEEYVKETNLAFTSIHLPFLYENLLSLFKPHCVENSVYTLPIPMGDMSMDCMSLHDFARCVVNIFLRPKNHMLKCVQLTGDRMTVQHMADVLNRHYDDRKFVYHKLNPDDFATFDFQGSQDLAAMFEFLQTAPHRDPRITRRIHHSVVCFDRWVSENKQTLTDAMKDTGNE